MIKPIGLNFLMSMSENKNNLVFYEHTILASEASCEKQKIPVTKCYNQ